jgi:3-dehydroquinate synthase
MAARLSAALGLIDATDADRITRLVERARLPVKGPRLICFADGADAGNASNYLNWMRHDKKSAAGAISYVLISAMGRAVVRPIADDQVHGVIDRQCA